jgi:hypothetical protein
MFGIPSWAISGLAGITIVAGIYFYGHHEGSLAGDAKVASITEQMASASEAFQRQVRTIEENNQKEVTKEKDEFNQQIKTQTVANAKLRSTINGLRASSNSYVAQIERLSGQDCTSSNAALELAYRQYNELAEALRQTSSRADSNAATANALNAYASRIN